MRQAVVFPFAGSLDWRALRAFRTFLYRRVGDEDQAWLGVGERVAMGQAGTTSGIDSFQRVKDLLLAEKDHVFGHFGYDLKNEVEALTSRHPARDGFSLVHWFVPRFVIKLESLEATLLVHPEDRQEGSDLMTRLLANADRPFPADPIRWEQKTAKETYLVGSAGIMAHLQRGDVYELNYCVERTAAVGAWDPYTAFARMLHRLDPTHAAFYRHGDKYALCASPERFLKFQHGKVIAQPMKGTRPRSADPATDDALMQQLANDPKERSENIMAVDVLRNDLSRVAASGSVQVEELCAVRRHPAVHQMTSTITAQLRDDMHALDAVRAAWPMASMTGAPKLSAMRMIDEVEDMRRGLFSGSLGYFDPNGNGDLNVVIRTVLYDSGSGRLSLTTGSALTAVCDTQKEWEECELKARSVINALNDEG